MVELGAVLSKYFSRVASIKIVILSEVKDLLFAGAHRGPASLSNLGLCPYPVALSNSGRRDLSLPLFEDQP